MNLKKLSNVRQSNVFAIFTSNKLNLRLHFQASIYVKGTTSKSARKKNMNMNCGNDISNFGKITDPRQTNNRHEKP